MKQNTEEYYLIFKFWSLDSNQWSILIGGVGVLLTFIGFLIAFALYKKQRKDNSRDAFIFFQSSLPELKKSIEKTIENLKKFTENIESDNFSTPILSAALNDKFLSKVNLVDLNRYYSENRKNKIQIFQNFLIDSNFFGDYHSYFTNEINYLRNTYLEKENIYSQWQLLRSNKFFSSMADTDENEDYKLFYANWVKELNENRKIFEFNQQGQPTKVKNRKELVENQIETLARDIFPYIQFSEKANDINLIANKVVAAYADISEIKTKIKYTFEKDIEKFENVLINLNKLTE
ncbi:hypothetical protein [Salegentibacter maritimus]|uniref:Phage abortive infection protein n=1 Tax=Salegentibacter maritimus TaxID=2794347 RepID=A0ABS0TJN6_9FLAO|nr:hypothetical protein [Salegentibacter maritimus]MBI6121246.1 hypothetical protein [Salegentibacter maritimus]